MPFHTPKRFATQTVYNMIEINGSEHLFYYTSVLHYPDLNKSV